MPIEIKNILELTDSYDTFLFDKWGVLWDGENLYPGVIDTFTKLKMAGKKIGIISNATLTTQQAEKNLTQFGLMREKHFDRMITSGFYMQEYIKQGFFKNIFGPNFTFYCYGQRNEELFIPWASHECNSLKQANLVYLGILADDQTPIQENSETQDFLTNCLHLNISMVCADPDICATHKGKLYYTPGAIADAYKRMGGKVYWFGKPYPGIFDFAGNLLKADKKTSVMIGDNLHTDIAGAKTAGLDSVLIYETGILAHLTEAERNQEIQKEGVVPTYTLGRVAPLKGEN